MERPLHVCVAEALGWQEIAWAPAPATYPLELHWAGKAPASYLATLPAFVADIDHEKRMVTLSFETIPRYDTDWSVTGPLIERYGISLAQHSQPPVEWVAFKNNINLAWGADCFGLDGYADEFEYGPTPLVAVCNLILELKRRGSLPTG
jgi:hypothetical protein